MPDMIVRTSAKSRLMRPGTRIRSEMPWTACCSTESATLNASWSDVPFSTTVSRRWFGIVDERVDDTPELLDAGVRLAHAPRALELNGFVTQATVSAPSSFAMAATTGAAPVPVPPPMPAVMKTMSAPGQGLLQKLPVLARGAAADLGVRAGARDRW